MNIWPHEFTLYCNQIIEQEKSDFEVRHGSFDDLMIDTLEGLGYDMSIIKKDRDSWAYA